MIHIEWICQDERIFVHYTHGSIPFYDNATMILPSYEGSIEYGIHTRILLKPKLFLIPIPY